MADDAPFVLDGFEPVTKLGGGGFGDVWLTRQTNIDRMVAVKIGHAPIDDDTVQLRFERECRALGRLSGHPNIIEVFTAGKTKDGRPYLVLEFVNGGTLWQRLQRAPLRDTELCRVGIDLCEALHVAHEAGVLHRDLKPENVLLRTGGEAVLGDFGIARLHDGAHTTSHAITASVAYAAPEILTGDSASTASDIYGVGVCLLACVLRSVPFVDKTDESIQPIINRVLSDKIPDLSEHGVAPTLATAIATMLNRDPLKRPVTAAAAGQLLKDALAELEASNAAAAATVTDTQPSSGAPGAAPSPGATAPVPAQAPSATAGQPSGLAAAPVADGPSPGPPPAGSPATTTGPPATPTSAPIGQAPPSATAAQAPPTAVPSTWAPPRVDGQKGSSGMDRIRLIGAALGGILLLGGLVVFIAASVGGDGDGDPSDPSTSVPVETASAVPLALPLDAADVELDGEVTTAVVELGPDATLFCDNRPDATGLATWEGQTFTPDPGGFPSIHQLLARFDSPAEAEAYVASYVGTVTCTEWTIPSSGGLPELVARPEVTDPVTSFGDATEEVRYEAEAAGLVTTQTRTALVLSGTDVLIMSVTSIDAADLDELDRLLRLATERLGI